MVDYERKKIEREKIPYPIRLAIGYRFHLDHTFGRQRYVSGWQFGYEPTGVLYA